MAGLPAHAPGPLRGEAPIVSRPCPHGGTANRGLVIRVGGTVLRPAAPCRPATHALLDHLAAVGFDGAPRVLAVGPYTETLTYIDGQAAVPPLAEDMLTDTALVSVADLVRRYHLAAASFDPSGYQWPRPIPAAFRTGLVSHNDVHPANLVFRGGRAVALIDFDLAGPAGRPGTSPRPRATGRRCRTTRTSPTAAAAARSSGSGSSCTPAGLTGPDAAAWPRRSWPITTGPTRSSPRRPRPGTRASPTTGAW